MSFTYPFARAALTVDVSVFCHLEGREQLLLIQRGVEPERGSWALPGGFVDVGDGLLDKGEDLIDAAYRELSEETGLAREHVGLRQLRAFGDPHRDRRWRIVTIAFTGRCAPEEASRITAGDDAAAAQWFDLETVRTMNLAFDHGSIWREAFGLMSQAKSKPGP